MELTYMLLYIKLYDGVVLSANLRDTNPQKSACRTRTLGLKHDMGILQSLSIPQLSCEKKKETALLQFTFTWEP